MKDRVMRWLLRIFGWQRCNECGRSVEKHLRGVLSDDEALCQRCTNDLAGYSEEDFEE